ncbi:hypothetical protein [Cytophaga hutchinsonii]|uniref:Uncharacterized protein n=1 Tax=Cytophaga hutchinsonii (strain ATCC 33406 / DSM 1761 / CIP 103989 / NBRC 15051 / NCIMB 9469 / D465) TaxID=269798 RepID=A0A6N4SR54_CYTH3|nr:hypothetical protein [Cytophaga hutchinsonii]ABG58863.1 hypothetical protein CHU_1593 [Cytophaga hutchinsonii ATCC 33406]SFX80875.1 hypothetical protein SAMN04487930_11060 [Cytophaga hutchinsonii ATCC 33406]
MEKLKILFWVVAIGIYIYTQIKDALKKGKRTDPIPSGSPIPNLSKKQSSQPVTTSTVNPYIRESYKPQQPKFAKRFQSTYSRKEELKQKNNPEADKYNQDIVSREAFYKQEEPVNYEKIAPKASVFGVDEHLQPYSVKQKNKHPLLTFLSTKSNLRNAFITGEILKRRD